VSDQRAVAFEFGRVTVVRAGRRVLDEVTARIPGAGITVVSGPSGAGKTTLLRLCNRLEVPDEGTVCYRGQPLDELDPLALASFSAAAVITLGVLFGLHVFPLTGRTLVPIAGMMVGNSMTATVLAGRRLTDELRDKRDEVEARLALGQPSRQAAAPYVRAALRAALTPQIDCAGTYFASHDCLRARHPVRGDPIRPSAASSGQPGANRRGTAGEDIPHSRLIGRAPGPSS
jgi:energy-coupling factor transporter ATP-binding protein EcfA2